MTSTPRTRKDPAERRAEILEAAGRLALEQGLERVTMKAVADELAVRPGLISHYFGTIDALLCEAFAHAASRERASLLPPEESSLSPREQLARFLHRIDGAASPNLGRLWLNARHLARYRPGLRQVVEEQETITRQALTGIVAEGARCGDFATDDPEHATVVILVTIDGLDSYSNCEPPSHPTTANLLFDVAETALGLPRNSLLHATEPDAAG
ncbi:TetR/AcrR family transcriptional regulator [Saccharopolyspora shandongensis]|uniref:TetR/AcrR family transcriptional regulator n=1 Tax=Saccharopolyspora shandongensis TaxID=418495 RepID=UPI0033D7B224